MKKVLFYCTLYFLIFVYMSLNNSEYVNYSGMKKLLDKNPGGIDLLISITSSGVDKIMSDLFIDKINFESQSFDNIVGRLNIGYDGGILINIPKDNSPVGFPFWINFKNQEYIDERGFKLKTK